MNNGDASRVLIPTSERKIIQDIREIAGNHGDDEIYAMLQECNMDPNEAAQKLLFLDTFHEVKRKRERKKESAINKEPHDSQWRSSLQGRGSRGRGGYNTRYQSYDAGGANPAKRDVANRGTEKGVDVRYQENANILDSQVSRPDFEVNDPSKEESLSSPGDAIPQISREEISPSSEHHTVEDSAVCHSEINSRSSTFLEAPASVISEFDAGAPNDAKQFEVGTKETNEYPRGSGFPSESANISAGAQRKEQKFILSSANKTVSAAGGRSQQAVGHQKGFAPNMEWKPKPAKQAPTSVSVASDTNEISCTIVEEDVRAVTPESSVNSNLPASKLQQKLEDLHVSERQHVIIPDHLQVPEAQRSGLSFGSFDASFAVETRSTLVNGSSNDRSSTFLSDSFQTSSNDAGSTLSEHSASSSSQQENLDHSPKKSEILSSKEAETPSDGPTMPEQEELRHEAVLSLESSQVSRMHTPPLYSAFGLVPPVLGGQFASFEGSETQNRESSAVAGFIQPFDPSANYYTQIYQPGADGDGRFSPYLAPAVSNYGGNTAIMPPYNTQLVQEGVSSPMLDTTINASAAQASGAMLTSAGIGQQPLPSYRQPGVHMPQYSPNYMPYGHYYSPFYVPTPIHPFFSGTHFAQQPLPSGLYTPPPVAVTAATAAAAAATMKYSQYKSGTGGSSPLPSSQPSSGGYSSGQPRHSNPSTVNDDPSAAQYKDSNVYITGQQNEGGAVWISGAGRELAGLQTGSFYNMPPAQSVNAFPGLYHPSQSLAQPVNPLLQPPLTLPASTPELAPPAAAAYQPSQRAQMNWAVNY
ncbi:flocculation protein (DUF1296) isoform X2 [Wolffia australiana]